MYFLSVQSWNSSTLWNSYLGALELLFDDKLVKLDESDPVRRRTKTLNEEGKYIADFKGNPNHRTLFGKFSKKTGVQFTLNYSETGFDQWGGALMNKLLFYIPLTEESYHEEIENQLFSLFESTIRDLSVFYAIADFKEFICIKKSHDGRALNIATEFLGMFWLTYFGPEYTKLLVGNCTSELPSTLEGPNDGVIIRLAQSPFQVSPDDRRNAEIALGEKYFAGLEVVTDFNRRKSYDQLLTIEQLRGRLNPRVN
jgi:hypothetical protein